MIIQSIFLTNLLSSSGVSSPTLCAFLRKFSASSPFLVGSSTVPISISECCGDGDKSPDLMISFSGTLMMCGLETKTERWSLLRFSMPLIYLSSLRAILVTDAVPPHPDMLPTACRPHNRRRNITYHGPSTADRFTPAKHLFCSTPSHAVSYREPCSDMRAENRQISVSHRIGMAGSFV